jgi:hypothetical protein
MLRNVELFSGREKLTTAMRRIGYEIFSTSSGDVIPGTKAHSHTA